MSRSRAPEPARRLAQHARERAVGARVIGLRAPHASQKSAGADRQPRDLGIVELAPARQNCPRATERLGGAREIVAKLADLTEIHQRVGDVGVAGTLGARVELDGADRVALRRAQASRLARRDRPLVTRDGLA